MLTERKRDAAANALLALSFAANVAQSPKDLIRSGHVEGPGIQVMNKMMQKRKKATTSGLDNPRVVSRGSKTFKEFVEEAYSKNIFDEGFKQMPGKLMSSQIDNLSRKRTDLQQGRQTQKKRDRFHKYEKQINAIKLAKKQDYNRKGESYGQFYQDPLKTGKLVNHRFR